MAIFGSIFGRGVALSWFGSNVQKLRQTNRENFKSFDMEFPSKENKNMRQFGVAHKI